MLNSSTSINWDQISNDFKEQRCIFLLGPGIANMKVNEQLLPIDTALAIHISEILDQYELTYAIEAKTKLSYMAQQFLNIPKVRRVDLEDITRNFYAKNITEIPTAYSILADFPSSIIVNTSPDNFMVQAYVEKGKDPISIYYNFRLTQSSRRNANHTPTDFDAIGPQKPLVFNLFGNLDHPESMVLTMEDQMDFIRNIVKGDPQLPSEFLVNFDDRKTYILLGFDVENWQFRLLLDSLNLQKENTTILPFPEDTALSSITKIFYEKRFNCLFLQEQPTSFAQTLRDQVLEPSGPKKHKIFIAYQEKDEATFNGLASALKTWEQTEQISIWHPGKLTAGDNRLQMIKEQINDANVILLLMSAHFLADDDIFDNELFLALEQANEKKAIVIPIIARPCDWRANRDLRKLSPIPAEGNAISDTEHWSSTDEAFYQIVQQLKTRLG